MIELSENDFATLAICAIRYCYGRQTYMPSMVQDIVRPYLKEVSDKDLHVMIQDCDYQERFNLYGSETVDRPGWIKWREGLIAERDRRKVIN